MKRRIESRPAGTRRPSAPASRRSAPARVREEDSRSPRMPRKTNAGEVPADRGVNEQESLTQGSE
jgi:hypothetical protein